MKQMKKRLLTAAMAACVLFSFTACDILGSLLRKRPQQKRLQPLKKRLLPKRQRLQRRQQLQKRPRRRLRLHLLRQRSRLQSPQRNLQRSPRLFQRDGKRSLKYGVISNMVGKYMLFGAIARDIRAGITVSG